MNIRNKIPFPPMLQLTLLDGFLIFCAFNLGLFLVNIDLLYSQFNIIRFLVISVFYITIVLSSLWLSGLYNWNVLNDQYEQKIRLGFAFIIVSIFVTEFSYFVSYFDIGITEWVSVLLTTTLVFLLLQNYQFSLIKKQLLERKILVLGAGQKALKLYQSLLAKNISANVVGFIHQPGERERLPKEKVHYSVSALSNYAHSLSIDEIVVAVDDRRNGFPMNELLKCRLSGINVVDLLHFYEREYGQVKLDILDPSWLIYANSFKKHNLQAFFKNLIDKIISAVLIVILSPAYFLIALGLIFKNGFSGKKLSRTTCNGRGNVTFEKYSFAVQSNRGFTEWLITIFKIRELPMLFNVLKGDMSLVGPAIYNIENMKNSDKHVFANIRYTYKPGLTGWAQVHQLGYNIDEQLQYDLFYVKNASLFLDLIILLKSLTIRPSESSRNMTQCELV